MDRGSRQPSIHPLWTSARDESLVTRSSAGSPATRSNRRPASRLVPEIIAGLIAAFALSPLPAAHADDTEIYLGNGAAARGANPNVLFIIDTSDSMSALVTVTTPYDPDTRYPATENAACAADDHVFFSSGDEVPGCADRNRFAAGIVRCADAIEALATTGHFLSGSYAAWLPRNRNRMQWRGGERRLRDQRALHVECAGDAGHHGAAPGGPAHPANGDDGPWSEQPGDIDPGDWTPARLYSANYIRWWHYQRETTTLSRLQIVQQVTRELVDSISGVNVGLMRFDTLSGNFDPSHGWARLCDPRADPLCIHRCMIAGHLRPCASVDAQGGPVVFPISDLDSPGARDAFKEAVDGLTLHGYTPLAESLYEAMLYYRGEPVRYGLAANGAPGHLHQGSHPDARDGSRYDSPIDHACGGNHVVLLSDGLPNTDNDADGEINALLSATTALSLGSCDNGRGQADDNCLDELAEYLYRTDSAPHLPGIANVTTHTVGFNLPDADILESAARHGGGSYHVANDARQLADAFSRIIGDILRDNATFTAPAVPANAFNRLTHRDELYFAVFQPDSRPYWPGNIKRFRLDRPAPDSDRIAILDANGREAIDPATGFFRDDARSFWSFDDDAPDGGRAEAGGLAGRLFDYADGQHDPASRAARVYTFTGADGAGHQITRLDDPVNRLHEGNAAIESNPEGRITRAMLGLPDDAPAAEVVDLLKWARGVDLFDVDDDDSSEDGRPRMGAPLHGRPVLVTYRVDSDNGSQDDRLFVLGNDGFLYMASTTDPSGSDTPAAGTRMEHWAFIPPDKLGHLKILYDNHEAGNILYGNDGGIDLWIEDRNGDGGLVDAHGRIDRGEHAYLYFGQRRGGSHYHALDVTDPDRPSHLWSVSATGVAPEHPLSRLGQSWSRPRHARMLVGADGGNQLSAQDVIVIGGGYDSGQDHYGARAADSHGNAVYILDARSGAVLWWAGAMPAANGPIPDLALGDMRYSIPADIRLIDVDGDGITDRFYAADTGGQIWRFDIDNALVGSLATRISGGRIADLQLASNAAEAPGESANRRFYYPPDIALISPTDGTAPFYAVAIGSGYRAHPNDTAIRDRIHVIRDHAVRGPPTDDRGDIAYRTRYYGELLDVGDLLEFEADAPQPLDEEQRQRLEQGWYIDLEARGEKVLAPVLTANGMILATSYIPADPHADNAAGACGPSHGSSRLYALDAVNGRPVANLDREGGDAPDELTPGDRFLELRRPGIAPEVTILFPEQPGQSPIPIVGTELVPELPLDNAPRTTYWYQHDVH